MRYGDRPFMPPPSGCEPSVTPADTPEHERTEDADASGADAPDAKVELEDAALDALIGRVEHARAHQLALSREDLSQLLAALVAASRLSEVVTHDYTITNTNTNLPIVVAKRRRP